jgi:hypothetical protein
MDYKIIVAGTRTFNDYALLETRLIGVLRGKRPSQVTIVSGGARGADSLGERFAREKKCKLARFPADWETYGKSAGYRRNAEMANFANACIVFWDGKSKGTKHMIDLAEKHGLELYIVNYSQE